MKTLAIFAAFVVLAWDAGPGASAANIILILTDDHGWSQMSESMDPGFPDARSNYLETPNMVRLIRQGMRFTSGYSPAPLCTPTRRSILCGTSAARSGPEFKSAWIPKDHLTIPQALKRADATEEGNDLASQQVGKAEALRSRLLGYLAAVGADKPKPQRRKK